MQLSTLGKVLEQRGVQLWDFGMMHAYKVVIHVLFA